MDVTAEILQNHLLYGGSDSTGPQGLSASRSLNYAAGPSISRPDNVGVSVLPFNLNYQGAVGLFGTENYFVKIKLTIDTHYARKAYGEAYWDPAMFTESTVPDPFYSEGVVDFALDLETLNTYEPARLSNELTPLFDTYVSVDLTNLKTGNIYIDNWLDVRLYTRNREEHPYDEMFIKQNDVFYIGFHARNTRRLGYNVNCLIGDKYISSADMSYEQRQKIARR